MLPGSGLTTLIGRLDNQGALTVGADLMWFNRGASTNTGTIAVTGGTLTLDQSVSGATFDTAGTINVSAGATFTMTGAGAFTNYNGGTLSGGTFDVAGGFKFPGAAISTLAADLTLDGVGSAVVNSTGGEDALASLSGIASTGRLTLLNGRNLTTSAGTAVMNAGRLSVGANCAFTAAAGFTNSGTLTGSGMVAAVVSGGGAITPGGSSPGVLTVNGGLYGTGPLTVDLDGTVPGTQFDQVAVVGAVHLGGPLVLNVGYTAALGDTYVIIDNDGTDPVVGTFTGLPEGAAVVAGGQIFRITYFGGNGNDVDLIRDDSGGIQPAAGTAVWDGAPDAGGTSADANWTTASNWVNDVAPASNYDLIFPASAVQKVNVNDFPAGMMFHSITFSGASYDLTGNGITLVSGVVDSAASGNNRFDPDIFLASPQIFSVQAGGETLSLGGAISGGPTAGLTKETPLATNLNAGTLRFDGPSANTFTGLFRVVGGTLELSKAGVVAVSGPITIGDQLGTGDAVVELGAGQIGDQSAVTVNSNGALSAGFGDTIGSLTLNAGGVLTAGDSGLTVNGLTTIVGTTASDTLAITAMSPFTAVLNGSGIIPITALGGVKFDGSGSRDTLIGTDADSTWTVTGTNAGGLSGPVPFTFTNVENLTGGGAADTFAFAPIGSVAGMVDGGGGTNALDYSAVTTPIHANLGISATITVDLIRKDATLFPVNTYVPTGTASLTYNAATGTMDVSASVGFMDNSYSPFNLDSSIGVVLDLLDGPWCDVQRDGSGAKRRLQV